MVLRYDGVQKLQSYRKKKHTFPRSSIWYPSTGKVSSATTSYNNKIIKQLSNVAFDEARVPSTFLSLRFCSSTANLKGNSLFLRPESPFHDK